MSFTKRIAILISLGVGLLALSAATIEQLQYSKFDKKFYLTDKEVAFVRPGLKLSVSDISVAADRSVSVTFTVTDDKGLPLDIDGIYTPGEVSTNFLLAYLPADKDHYINYVTRSVTSPITGVTAVQPTSDRGGTMEKVGDGTYRYTYKTKLPPGDDFSATHTVGLYFRRDLTEFEMGREVANEVVNFVPSGAPVTKVLDEVRTEKCNQCHDPLGLHGGIRQKVELCVMCHYDGVIDPDTGNTVDLRVMIHKIHRGENLPSVEAGTPYKIIGHNQSVHDFSDVVFPPDVRDCQKCHDSDAVQADAWFLKPSRAACGSCHDDVNFATGQNHVSLPQTSDKFCSFCHFPQGDLEFDASIKGAHLLPYRSTQLKGINISILEVTNSAPGQHPTVRFTLKNNDGSTIDPSSLNFFNFVMAGPTTDFEIKNLVSESALADSVPSGDAFTYTFKAAIAGDAQGSFAMGAEAYRNVMLNPGTEKEFSFRETAENPVVYFAVTDPEPVPRRTNVIDANCEQACHVNLALHGTIRHDPKYCVLCHEPQNNDSAFRPEGETPHTIDFKFLIHRIHRGEDLTREFTVVGFHGSLHTFNDVRFPGDLRDCQKCHVDSTFEVPSRGIVKTIDENEFYSPIPPNSAACMGCHDDLDAAAHTYVHTAPFGEACGSCHSAENEFAVAKVHARTE